jgi:hypothetical protein
MFGTVRYIYARSLTNSLPIIFMDAVEVSVLNVRQRPLSGLGVFYFDIVLSVLRTLVSQTLVSSWSIVSSMFCVLTLANKVLAIRSHPVLPK